jgi:hypothetical protein
VDADSDKDHAVIIERRTGVEVFVFQYRVRMMRQRMGMGIHTHILRRVGMHEQQLVKAHLHLFVECKRSVFHICNCH